MVIIGILVGIWSSFKIIEKNLGALCELNDKYFGMIKIFSMWMKFYEEGHSIDEYFKKNGYKSIAIYGMGFLGEHFFEQIKKTDIEVRYLIDQKGGTGYDKIPVFNIDEYLAPVDVIVITPQFYFYQIKKQLKKNVNYKIICIDEVFR